MGVVQSQLLWIVTAALIRDRIWADAICTEGLCRTLAYQTHVQICASGYWQDQPVSAYQCINGSLSLQCNPERVQSDVKSFATTSTVMTTAPTAISTYSTVTNATLCSATGQTGFSYCSKKPAPCREDQYGVASYTQGGKMASVYHRNGGAFRCDIDEPSNGFYVAFWTQYESALAMTSQPMPINCGEVVRLTNPLSGVTADALVVDRCASCVGVDKQLSDPDTPDSLSNGATVDLSEKLWDTLYAGAPAGVYDVVYNGTSWPGSTTEPASLVDPMC